MGLGKTLTMIALILTQKKSKEKDETTALTWLSKNGIPKCLACLLLPKSRVGGRQWGVEVFQP